MFEHILFQLTVEHLVLQEFVNRRRRQFLPRQETLREGEIQQYQVFDSELKQDVLEHLPSDLLAKIDRTRNRIFWDDLKGLLPLNSSQRLQLSAAGCQEVRLAMEQYGIPEDLFRTRKTVAFVWRYRGWGSAVKPIGQPPPEALVEKYSRVFRRLIDEFDCHVLITGMNPVLDETNRHGLDPKYARFGLDLPAERCTYLQGLSLIHI